MGIVSGTVTQQYLIAYQNELEYKISLIEQAKLGLSSSVAELVTAGSDLDPESPAVKQLEMRRERLNALEKRLDMQLAEYQTKLGLVKNNQKSNEKQMGG